MFTALARAAVIADTLKLYWWNGTAWTTQGITIVSHSSNELRGLAVYDLDGDGTLEIIVTGAVYGRANTWVLEHDGTTRAGWPQLSSDSGYVYGVFNDNAAIGDLDGDGAGEIVALHLRL